MLRGMDFENAQKAWRNFAHLKPENNEGFSRAANALLKLGRKAAAREILERALEHDKDNLEILLELADLHLDDENTNRADEYYSHAIDIAPEDGETLARIAHGRMRIGNYSNAEGLLKRAIRRDPANVSHQLKLAEALIHQGRITPAYDLLLSAANKSGLSSKAYSLAALSSAVEKDFDFAVRSFARAHAGIGNDPDHIIWFVKAAQALGHWTLALNALKNLPDEPRFDALKLNGLLDALDADYVIRQLSDAPANAISDQTLAGFSDTWMKNSLQRLRSLQSMRAKDIELRIALTRTSTNEELKHIQIDPGNPSLAASILFSMATACLRVNDRTQAMTILRVLRDRNQSSSWLDLLEGITHQKSGDLVKAVTMLTSAAENPQIKPLALFHLAETALLDQDITAATHNLSEALSFWKREAHWQHRLGTLYLLQNNHSAALPHLQMAVEFDPDNNEFLTALARSLARDSQFVEAATIYERLLQLEPTDSALWAEGGNLVLEMGDAQRAQNWFARACSLGIDHVSCQLGAAQAALQLGNPDKALQYARNALEKSPHDSNLLVTLGDIYREMKDNEEAIRMYDLALDAGDTSPKLTSARIQMLIDLERFDTAVTELKALINSNPEDDSLWMLLAKSLEKSRKYSAALEAASRAMRIAPRNSEHRLIIARMCRKLGQLDRALDELLQAQELAPHNSDVHIELARVYEDRKDAAKAIEIYQKVLHMDPDNSLAPYRAGLLFKNMKAYQEAGSMFKLAVNLNPKDPDAMHQLAAVKALELVHGETLKTAVSL